jgi:P-type Cu+ transporter
MRCLARILVDYEGLADRLGVTKVNEMNPASPPIFVDPVCGMTVSPAKAHGPHTHREKDYYFCSAGCFRKFESDPERYSGPMEPHKTLELSSPGSMYTCPMHPEIKESIPGSCPKCGMALEPMEVTSGDQENPEYRDMLRRFWVSLILTTPVFVMAMSEHLAGSPLRDVFPGHISGWIQLCLSTPVVLWGGFPFFQRGWNSLVSRNFNMFTLIALGTGVSFLYSFCALLFPNLFPEALHDSHGQVPLYFESAAVITTLVLLGQVLELKARSKTSGAIQALLQLSPTLARRVLANGEEEDIPLDHVRVGDRLRVRPGDRVPIDGVILEGSAILDESMITGEPIPVEKGPGDAVNGGTLNGTGSFMMKTEKVGDDTLLAQIVRLVSEAQRTKAPIQRVADSVANFFVPAVLLVSVITFLIWAAVGPHPSITYALVNSVAVLLIACPCALGLATPVSIMVATGRGAKMGVLFRNAEALEVLGRTKILVVDKTGTLTEGRPRLVSLEILDGMEEDSLLVMAAGLERASEHPLAEAIVSEAQKRGLRIPEPESFESLTGRGVIGRVEGKEVVVGSLRLLRERGIDPGSLHMKADSLHHQGQTVLFLAIGGNPAGLLGVADPIKDSTPEAIRHLRDEGVQVVMLTGDNRTTAQVVADRLGIRKVKAEILPQEKKAVVEQIQKEGSVVAMVGDGVNDAPALAQADVGIAMGTGAGVAVESAGITLVSGDLGGVVRARTLSRVTLSNIRQNLFLAFIYNIVAIPVAAGVLYPSFGLLLNPMIAAAAMSLSSVSVIGNALRLRQIPV